MPHGLSQLLPKIVALLLVLAHTGVASLRGIALCIPVGDCERAVCASGGADAGHSHSHHDGCAHASHRHAPDCAHAHGQPHGYSEAAGHGHSHSPGQNHGHSHGHSHGHPHGFLDIARHQHDDCGCHVHVAVPDQEELVRLRSGEADGVARPVPALVPMVPVASELVRASMAAPESVPRPAWPPGLARMLDGRPAAERLGLAAVVLLI